MGSVPPLTAMFRDVGTARGVLPVFVPAACDGDPALWTTCPDGSVAALVIAPRTLIDAGLELVTASGGSADALRAVAAPLARNVNRVLAGSKEPPETAGGLLEAAFAMVADKKGIDGERRAELDTALHALVAEIGELPVARTPLFFDEPEEQAPGSGELFCLVVNPDACKSPALLAATGRGHGLDLVEQTPERVAAARRTWALWERLPDTTGATIERARTSPRVGPLAAVMLSRHGLHAMAGGDGAEAASGAKLALRQVMGLAEFHLQPRLQKRLAELDALQERLGATIRDLLADALPTTDLDALAEGLDVLGRTDVSITNLSARVDDAVLAGHVDGARLGRLVDAARALADLRWRLAEGADGLARARAGVTIAPGAVASWAGVYPFNPWRCPATVASGDEAGPLARGLLEGHLRSALDGIRWTRRATMELERPGEAAHASRALAALSFDDLDPAERELCPPMVLVGDDGALGSRGLAQLAWLLDSNLPVKIVILGDIGGRADSGLAVDALGDFPAGGRFDLALLAMLTRTAYVAQTSVGAPDHFAASVLGAFASPGPALVHIHAPSPERHGFAPERLLEQARLAVRSRAFPLLRFDPAAAGVFGTCLDLAGNPDPGERWAAGDVTVTPADWAVTERRFDESLPPLAADAPGPTPIAEYLDLAPGERDARTPFVLAGDGSRRAVAPALCADAAHRLRFWRTLQEFAGVVTPFTEAVRAEADRAVADRHRTELDELRRAHEARVAQLRAEFEIEATQRVASGLMALAGYGADGNQTPGGEP
jgi:pyruvate-ferredoxin/flavodoxin oxidoreductase